LIDVIVVDESVQNSQDIGYFILRNFEKIFKIVKYKPNALHFICYFGQSDRAPGGDACSEVNNEKGERVDGHANLTSCDGATGMPPEAVGPQLLLLSME